MGGILCGGDDPYVVVVVDGSDPSVAIRNEDDDGTFDVVIGGMLWLL